jgi:hypothetical protein
MMLRTGASGFRPKHQLANGFSSRPMIGMSPPAIRLLHENYRVAIHLHLLQAARISQKQRVQGDVAGFGSARFEHLIWFVVSLFLPGLVARDSAGCSARELGCFPKLIS